MDARPPARWRLHALLTAAALAAGGLSGAAAQPVVFDGQGHTQYGDWTAGVTVSEPSWRPGQTLQIEVRLRLSDGFLPAMGSAGIKADQLVLLVTAERTFDADGWLRLPSDERMSTLLTPTGLAIEGGVQGAVTNRYGYPFRSPLDEYRTLAVSWTEAVVARTFSLAPTLPLDLPPGLYRLRFDFGAKSGSKLTNLNGTTFASRPSSTETGTSCYFYSPIFPASGTHISGRQVNGADILPRFPWLLLQQYNSNGYRGVVADEDKQRFAISDRNIIPDEVILPLYDNNGNRLSYSLEPQFPVDTIDTRANIPWNWASGELSVRIFAPDGTVTSLGPQPFVSKSGNGPSTGLSAFKSWKPPAYGYYTVVATGWIADIWGRHYTGGGTYHFWIAKRMTLATATFQGMPYPVGSKYGRDIQFNPALPASVTVTATLFPNSDPAQARTLTYTGQATSAGLFGAAQGMKAFPLDAPGEYHAQILATHTDLEGHLWVCTMRHAGVVYEDPPPVLARGKKLLVGGQYVERGETRFEGYVEPDGTQHLAHIAFPYQPRDVLLIGTEGQGANKIEPVLIYQMPGDNAPWDTKLNGVGTTNLRIKTSNGYSPHLYPEYITDIEYYYAAAPRPGFMGRFLVGESTVRAPYWPVSPNSFGGQIGASPNGDSVGDIYRLLGGVVLRRVGQVPLYAGYLASAFLLPKGTNNNRVIAPGSEDLVGPTGEKARFFLVGLRPGTAYEVGSSFRPAIQIDPLVPASIRFVLTYPDGRQQVAEGIGDQLGYFAGSAAWPLDIPGIYRYQIQASWNGFAGRMPGLPDEGGEFYVYTRNRPAGVTGLRLDGPSQRTFSAATGTIISGSSSASSVRYAMLTPGAVIEQGNLPVTNGRFQFVFDPAAVHARAPIYDIVSITTGQPQIGRVIHLTFFSEERGPDGASFFDVSRVILRGTTTLAAQSFAPHLMLSVTGSGSITVTPPPARSCGTDCHEYAARQDIVLTAVPDPPQPPTPGSVFAGWSGHPDCLDGRVTLSGDIACSATFVRPVSDTPMPELLDLNGDGRSDVFRYRTSSGKWTADFSDGGGQFGSVTGNWSAGWQIVPVRFRTAGDLFVYNSKTGYWYKCFGNGRGGFTYAGGTWSPGWQLHPGDFNGDGAADLFVYNSSTGAWYVCLTTGADASGFAYVGGQWSPSWQIVVTDLDGNGRSDLFVYNSSNGRWYRCLSDGQGGFSYAGGLWSAGWQLTAGDFNGDGLGDLFTYNTSTGRWYVCLNTGTSFDYQGGVWSPRWTVRSGDFNADGRSDLFVYNGTSGLWYACITNGLASVFDYAGGVWSPGWQVFTADLNGDRRADVLVYNATTGAFYQCLTTEPGSFAYTGGNWGTGWTVVTR